MLSWCANTKLVLSKDPEYVFLEFDQSHSSVSGLFDSGGQPVPDLTVSSTALHNVIGYSGATIITRRVPGQETGIIGDLRDVKGSRRTRLICVEKYMFQNECMFSLSVLSPSSPRMLTSTVAVARPQLFVASMM